MNYTAMSFAAIFASGLTGGLAFGFMIGKAAQEQQPTPALELRGTIEPSTAQYPLIIKPSAVQSPPFSIDVDMNAAVMASRGDDGRARVIRADNEGRVYCSPEKKPD